MIKGNLHLRQSELRAQGIIWPPEANVLRHDSLIPLPAKPGELEVQTLGAQFFQERPLDEIWQADLVEINYGANEGKNEQPEGHPQPAEVNPAHSPKAALARLRFQMQLRNRQRGQNITE